MSESVTTTPPLHPKAAEARNLMRAGRMNRREFVRIAALLGVSASAAYAMAGLPAPAMAAEGTLPFPPDDPKAQAGGVLRVAMQVQKMEDPATFSWTEMSNQARHFLEYLTLTGPDNVTRPMLAERWEASGDLKTWTFHLRRNVMWHNGDLFTADDVIFNLMRWVDPALGSSNVGLSTIAAMLEAGEGDSKRLIDGAIEKVDAHTVRLNLAKPVLSVPEDFYNYPAAIVHRGFTAPLDANPNGTGPWRLKENIVGKRCILEKVTKTDDGKDFVYWGGKTWLDAIHYYNFDEDNQLTTFASGEVDAIYEFGIEQLALARALEAQGHVLAAKTAQTLCCRMQVDRKPFDDVRVRRALQLAVDTSTYNELVFQGLGTEGEHHHVAPIHPEYFPLPKVTRDLAAAKRLLAEAGYPDGIDLTIDVGNTDGPWHQAVCEVMRDQVRDAGIRLSINVMPASKYWEIWDKTAFGATSWTHRPLGTQVLSLGYRSGVPWNETHFASPDFDAALDAAEATLDVAARKAQMEKVEQILQDAAVMVQPVFRPVFTIASRRVHGYAAHPTQNHQFNKVWVES